ncbi:MAG: tetratricopeptide (TPR) repeat protein [Bacteroidia bacterium]|jgi:tetratricopeptide (TPR) repeat protein
MRKLKILATTIGVIATSSLLWHSQAKADAIDHYQPAVLVKAEKALQEGRPFYALRMLDGRVETLQQASFRAAGNDLLCQAHFQTGHYEMAEAACDKAVGLNGGAAAWSHVNNRGVMRLLQGKIEAALEDFQRASSLNPRAISVRKNASLAKKELQAEQS